MSIRVLYPADVLRHRRYTGLQRYTSELATALADIADIKLTVLADDLDDVSHLPDSIERRVRGPLPGRIDRPIRCVLPPRWLRDYDIVHCPTVYGPFLRKPRGVRMITTVHDLISLVHPETVSRANRFWFRRVMPRILPIFDHCIAISECTRRDMTRWWGDEHEAVTVIPEASHLVPLDAPTDSVEDEVLMVGTLEPRKNLARAIEAFVKLTARRPDLPDRLVLIGKWGWADPSLARLIEHSDRVQWLGHVDEQTLRERYRRAKAFLFPSLYEGFGLPVLEAMSMGCPVVASSASATPEVGADAAVYFDPTSVDDIAQTLESVLSDDEQREQMRTRSLARAREFSWQRCASETVDVYKAVLEQAP